MGDRVKFWLKVLRRGAIPLNSAAGWLGTVILILGIAGIVVPLVFHLPPLLIAVVLVSLLVLVVAEGSYRAWHDTDEERKQAIAEREAARNEIASQASTHQRMAQAKQVHVRRTLGLQPETAGKVYIDVKNDSEDPIRGLVFSWLKGNAPWDDPQYVDYVPAGKEVRKDREFPGDLPPGADKEYSAVVYFRDNNQVCWRATPDGDLVEGSP